MRRILTFLAIIVCLSVVSCTKDTLKTSLEDVEVSYDTPFVTFNTSGLRYLEIQYVENGKSEHIPVNISQGVNSYTGSWFTLSVSDSGKYVYVELSANETGTDRELVINLDDYDIYNRVKITQKSK